MKKQIIACNHNGKMLKLIPTSKSGGEGTIHLIQGKGSLCAKIFHPNRIDKEIENKIKSMISNPPSKINKNHKSIAWPNGIVYDGNKKSKFIGYTMPYIDTKSFLQSHRYYDSDDRTKLFEGNFTWRHLFLAACNLSSAIAALHEKGHCIGDLRETNILVGINTLITLIDCDSFQIKDKHSNKIYYTRVGTPEYLPLELLHANFGANNYDRYYSDLFALGIMIFKFLMNGIHPYQARGKLVDDAPTTAAKIEKGYFPYLHSKSSKYILPPTFAPPFEMLPPPIQELFRRCFVEGHKDPQKRPSAKEWFKALKKECS